MGRKSRKEEIARAVREYLAMAEHHPPDEWIIDVKHVAAAVGASRTSLYAYALADEIKAVARRQRERSGLSGEAVHRRRLRDQIRQLRQELTLAGAQQGAPGTVGHYRDQCCPPGDRSRRAVPAAGETGPLGFPRWA